MRCGVLSMVLLLAACGGGGDAPACASAGEALAAVNAARSVPRMCGARHFDAAAALVLSPVLVAAAERHAADMARAGVVSHVGSDGSSVGQRAGAPAGENVAGGQADLDAVMRAFLDSPGHCANVMNPWAKTFGAACVETGSGYSTYWAQLFGV